MRHLVTIEQRSESISSTGGVSYSWSTLATRRMSVQPAKGSEPWVSDQAIGQNMVEFRTRFDAVTKALTTNHRLKLSNNDSPETFRTFDIEGRPVNDFERNKEIIIHAREADVAQVI